MHLVKQLVVERLHVQLRERLHADGQRVEHEFCGGVRDATIDRLDAAPAVDRAGHRGRYAGAAAARLPRLRRLPLPQAQEYELQAAGAERAADSRARSARRAIRARRPHALRALRCGRPGAHGPRPRHPEPEPQLLPFRRPDGLISLTPLPVITRRPYARPTIRKIDLWIHHL